MVQGARKTLCPVPYSLYLLRIEQLLFCRRINYPISMNGKKKKVVETTFSFCGG
jgi:hypothetical protein